MSTKDSSKQDTKARVLTDIRALARLLRQYDLSEIELEREGERICLRREAAIASGVHYAPAPVAAGPTAPATAQQQPAGKGEGGGGDEKSAGVVVTSPFVGTFYRAPSPESPPFVERGQRVSQGATLCIVEAMKLMNEIEAEADCTIEEVLVGNGEPVEFGQALFRVSPP